MSDIGFVTWFASWVALCSAGGGVFFYAGTWLAASLGADQERTFSWSKPSADSWG